MSARYILGAALLICSPSAFAQTPVAPPSIPDTPAAYRTLRFPPLKKVPVPNIASYTLPNGLKIYLLEDHELPVLNGTVRVRTGNLFEPADKIGLAGVTGTVMRTGGTQAKTGDQLDQELENIAASVESDIGETSGSVSFSALKENTDEVMGIFKDVITAPEFRQDKIDLALSELRSGLARRNDDAHGIADREFSDIVYGKNTPYGWQMTYATIDNIKRPDIVAFYKRYFFPANMLMAVWGDFSTAEMKEKLNALFGGWKYEQPKVPRFPAVERTSHPGIYLAEKDDVTQTFLMEGHLGGERIDKDYPALVVMADILGGGFQSRLVQRIRTQLGLVYDISADWSADYDHPGLFEISGSTKSASTAETLKAVAEQIARIRTSQITEDELETARQTALNGLVFAFDTQTKTLARVLNYEYYGYPQDFVDRFQKGLETVTRADVLRAASTYVNPANMTIVAVGRVAEFRESLATLGLPISSIDLTIPDEKPAATQSVPASPPGDASKARELLARVRDAVGGTDKLANVKDMVEVAQLHVANPQGMSIPRTDRWIAPSYFREETTLPFGTVTIYGDGKAGWMASPQGQTPISGQQMKPIDEKLLRMYFLLLLSDRMEGRTVNLAGDGALEIADARGSAVRLFVDEKTNLPLKLEYKTPSPGGASTIEETYNAFQDVDGIKLPKQMTILQNGQKYADVTIESVKLNSGLKVEDLSKKP